MNATGQQSSHPLADDLDVVLQRIGPLWEELRDRRIFITGGTGFFGKWLLESFAWANNWLNLGAEALVLTRNYEAFKEKVPYLASHPSIHFHSGDVRNFVFPEGEFSHIIHAATSASTRLNNEDPDCMYDTIVEGTRHILDFAVRCNAAKVLLASSGAVYGRQPREMARVPETYENPEYDVDQRSAYADGKRAAEELCSQYSEKRGIEISIARCFAFVGPYLPLDIHYAIGNFMRDALDGGPIVVNGDGTPYRSYLYAADLAVWLWTILLKGRPCRPYNVGSDQAICISDLACKIAGFFENRPDVVVMGTKDPSAPVQRYIPDITRSRTELGLDIYTDIDEAIKRTLAFLKKTGSG